MVTKEITLTVGENEFKFKVSTTEYNTFVNDMKPDSKIVPAKNFVKRCLVDKGQTAAIEDLCDHGLAPDLAGALIEEFRPKLEIEIKK